MPKRMATWNPARGVWERTEASLLCEHLAPFSETLPAWGSMRNGVLYQRQTRDAATVERGSLLLPTPTVQDGENTAGPSQLNRNSIPLNTLVTLLPTPVADHSRGLPQPGTDFQSLPNVAISLLPTPTVMDMGANYTPEQWEAWKAEKKAQHNNGNGHGASLTQEAISLLPTPKATNNENQQRLEQYGPNLGMVLMPDQYEWTGAATPPRLPDGSASSDEEHQPPLFPA